MFKRRLLACILVFSLVLSFSGCSFKDYAAEPAASKLNTIPVDKDPNAPKIVVAENGKSGYVIVRGKAAGRSEVFAAAELAEYIKKSTGAQIAVVTDDVPETAREILVGKTNRVEDSLVDREALGTDGFLIKVFNKKLIIAGGEIRGTLYGVYDFLEDFLGCRFFTASLEIVPRIDKLAVNTSADISEKPLLNFRDTLWESTFSPEIRGKLRLNGELMPGYNGSGPLDVNFDTVQHHCGTIFQYVGQEYFETHPEYFAMNEKGERTTGQACFSSEGLFNTVLKLVRTYFRENPDATCFYITPNDNPNYCQCPACAAIDAREGSHCASTLRFVNRIANAVKDEFPGKTINMLAYMYTRTPPKTIVPADNVVIQIAAEDCRYMKPYKENSPKLVSDLEGWAAKGSKLLVWDYTTNHAHFNALYPNVRVVIDNVKWFYEHGATGIFLQGNGFDTGGEFGELRAYIAAKILWNPYCDIEKDIREFMQAYYGDGYTNILKFMDFTADKANADWHGGDALRVVALTNSDLRYCDALWDAAESYAGNATQLFNVRRSRIQLRYYKSMARKLEFSTLDLFRRISANKKLYNDMKELGIRYIHEERRIKPEKPNLLQSADKWKENEARWF